MRRRTIRTGPDASRGAQAALTLAISLSALATPGLARANETSAATTSEAPALPSPWRGSTVAYEHLASAISLSKSAEQSYVPFYQHRLSIRPSYHFTDNLFARIRFDLEQEFTNAVETDRPHEVVASDLWLWFGADHLELPWLGIVASADLMVTLPISKESAAQSLRLGLAPGVSISKKLDVLAGLTLGLSARATFYLHQYTTAQLDAPWLACGDDASPTCGQFVQTGERNVANLFAAGPSVDLAITDALSASAFFLVRRSGLYGLSDARVAGPMGSIATTDAADDVAARYSLLFILDATYAVNDLVSISLGTFNVSPQLAPDSSYRTPFFNRYSEIYVDVTAHLDDVLPRF